VNGEDQQKASNAIIAVRKDSDPTDWMFLTYAGTTGPASQQLKFGGTGTGGVDTLKGNFDDSNIAYALISITDKIDDSVTVKFVWIHWLGCAVGSMMKARSSTQMGAIKDFMGQAHISHACNTQNEISSAIIREKVMATSGSGSSVIDEKTGQAGLRTQSTTSISGRQTSSSKSDDSVIFDDDCIATLQDVRNDNTPTTWAAFTYANPNSQKLVKLSTGTGGAIELEAVLKDDIVVYALIRKLENIDSTVAVKFCYVRWLGENIPRMQRAKLGATAATIQQFFLPYHVSLDSPDRHEITDPNIMKLIMIASGTYQHTLDDSRLIKPQSQPKVESSQPQSAPNKIVTSVKPVSLSSGQQDNTKVNTGPSRGMGGEKQTSASTKIEGVVSYQDEDAITGAIKAVRNDSDPTDWCLITYTAPKSSTLKFHASGSGGLEELRTHLKDDVIMYGLIRTNEQIDDTVAIKFCFIDWRGENINRMQRANLGVHSGAITALFRPYHADLQCADHSELTMDIIMKKIKFVSGTAVHVK